MGQHVILTGVSGHLGREVGRTLLARGDTVTVLSRNPVEAEECLPGAHAYVGWTGLGPGPWMRALEGADALLHLAGATPAEHPQQEAELQRHRLWSTRSLVQTLDALRHRPRVLVSASSAAVYGPGLPTDSPADEHALPGTTPLARHVRAWESAATEAREVAVRVVPVRLGLVLDADAGPLPHLVRRTARGLGGPTRPRQALRPWVHLADAVGLVLLALEQPDVTGPLNAVAPEACTSARFARTLAATLGRPGWLPQLPTRVRHRYGEGLAALLTGGRPVVPRAALQHGYAFRFPALANALESLLGSPQATRSAPATLQADGL